MKGLFLIVFCSVLFLGPSSFEWITEKEYDFGLIEQGKPQGYDFQFVNISDEPISIDNVRESCGCTAPSWSEAPILPGDTSTIQIVYNAKKIGYFRKKIKVYISSQRKAEVLYVEGEVE